MSDNYSFETTADIRRRRCAWRPEESSFKTQLLCDDACRQLELAQAEIELLTARVKDAERIRSEADDQMQFAFELLATHEYPAEPHEVDRENEDEDWEEEKT